MKANDISKARDTVLRSSYKALRRASALARETAIQTGTEFVVVVDGRLTIIDARKLSPRVKRQRVRPRD